MVMQFHFKSNVDGAHQRMSNLVAMQMPFAISKALNDTARTLVKKNRQDMTLIFNRTNTFTKNAFGSSPTRHGPMGAVKKGQYSVFIRRKEKQSGRHYLEVQEFGGSRKRTGIERLIQQNLPTQRLVAMVSPTHHFKRKKDGGISMGEVNKMLSALHLQADPLMNSPVRGQTGKTKRSRQFFTPAPSHPLGQGKRFGIYERTPAGNAKKMLNISERTPNYKPKLRFEERMHRYAPKVYRKKLAKAIAFALRTAKIR